MCDIAADFIERRYPFSRDGASRGQDRLVVMRDVQTLKQIIMMKMPRKIMVHVYSVDVQT